jgi:hypothetical protein
MRRRYGSETRATMLCHRRGPHAAPRSEIDGYVTRVPTGPPRAAAAAPQQTPFVLATLSARGFGWL